MRTLVDVLESHHVLVLERWMARVQRHHAPARLSPPTLANHIPEFLAALAAALRRADAGEDARAHRVAPLGLEHGRQRLHVGFDLAAVVREYGDLHDCILEVADEVGVRLAIDDLRVLVQGFAWAVSQAVLQYAPAQQAAAAEPPTH